MTIADILLVTASVGLALLILGVALVTTVYLVRAYHLPNRPLPYVSALLGIGLALLAVGPVCYAGVLAQFLIRGAGGGLDFETMVIWGAISVVLSVPGILFLLLWKDGRRPLDHLAELRTRRFSRTIQVFGWCLIGLTIGTIGLVFVFPAIMFVFAAICLWGNHRRAQQANLLWMLAIATEKSIPLPDEVDAFAASTWGPRRSKLILLADMLRSGTPLPNCLEAIPGLIPKSTVPAVYLGDEAGQISLALRTAAVHQTNDLQESRLYRTLSYTSFYVWGLLTMISAIVAFLMVYIVPKFKAIFAGFQVELPAATEELVWRAELASKYFYLTFPVLSLPFFMLVVVCLGHIFGWDSLDVPLVGWLSRLETPLILRGLSRVVAGGRPLPDGLRVLSEHHHRKGIRAKAERMRYFVERGADCWEQLGRERFLHRAEVALLQSAQRIGNLPWVLNELADVIERRLQRRVVYAAQFIQPVFVVLMGIIVGSICVGFFMPIIKVINDLS